MMRPSRWFFCLVAAAVGSACARDAAPRLPALELDDARTAVTGLSSGAYMAGQVQLAYSELFPNAALVAGGPYGCSEGGLARALGSCMKGEPPPAVPTLVERAVHGAERGAIAPLANLAQARIYLLHGTADTTVAPAVAAAGVAFYRELRGRVPGLAGMTIDEDGDRAFGHNLPVAARGDDCASSQAPYLGQCGFDAAGEIFARLFGAPRHAVAPGAQGQARPFDQDALRLNGADALLAATGYVYVPTACTGTTRCGLLVALHGCRQDAGAIGTAFVEDAGFNRWADAYDVVVLYPQVRASFAPLNPQACWDWWGYSGADYDTRQGLQLRWLVGAVHALGLRRGT